MRLSLVLLAASVIAAAQPARDENNLVYEIFVRSFADSNGDGIGDLNGITAKLDSYLNDGRPETDHDLEVGVLWLTPIFPSPTYHGYNVSDYRSINPAYGSLADFRTLLAEAHKRGVRVIVDLPVNHTSSDHPWFIAALKDPSSPERKYYRMTADGPPAPRWHRATGTSGAVRYFGLFSARMPDLTFDHLPVREEMKAIAKFWLDLGVDGFRLDAAKHVYGDHFGEPFTDDEIDKNNAWWQEFSRFVYAIRPDALLLGEVLGSDDTMRRHAPGLSALINDTFMNEVRRQLAEPRPGLVAALRRLDGGSGLLQLFHFVGSHDRNPRLASDLEEAARRRPGMSADASFRLGMYLLLGLAARPIWYAGDEVMQRGWKWRGNPTDHATEPGDGSGIYDETLREPFPWYRSGAGPGQTTWFAHRFDRPEDGVSREEQDVPDGMLGLFRALTNLRTRHPVLANGEIGAVLADTADWIGFERVEGATRYLVLINRTATGHDYRLHDGSLPRYRGARVVFWSNGGARTWSAVMPDEQPVEDSVFVPAYGLVILRAR